LFEDFRANAASTYVREDPVSDMPSGHLAVLARRLSKTYRRWPRIFSCLGTSSRQGTSLFRRQALVSTVNYLLELLTGGENSPDIYVREFDG
jgi:hypothetical protein